MKRTDTNGHEYLPACESVVFVWCVRARAGHEYELKKCKAEHVSSSSRWMSSRSRA